MCKVFISTNNVISACILRLSIDWGILFLYVHTIFLCVSVCGGGQTKVLVSLPQCIKSSCYAVSPAVISNFILSHCCRIGLSAPSIPPLAWGPTWPFLPGGRGRLWLLMLCYFWSTVNTHYVVNITKITYNDCNWRYSKCMTWVPHIKGTEFHLTHSSLQIDNKLRSHNRYICLLICKPKITLSHILAIQRMFLSNLE